MALDIFRLAVDTPCALRQENEEPNFFPLVPSFR
jgi:hypothetical protein